MSRIALGVLILGAALSVAGCDQRSDVHLSEIESRLSEVGRQIDTLSDEIKRVDRAITQAQSLNLTHAQQKERREAAVRLFDHLALELAAARAFDADTMLFKEHQQDNVQRQRDLIDLQSPDRAKLVGPFAAYVPYSPQFERLKEVLYCQAHRDVYRSLDRARGDSPRHSLDTICEDINRHFYIGEERLKQKTNAGCNYPLTGTTHVMVDDAWKVIVGYNPGWDWYESIDP